MPVSTHSTSNIEHSTFNIALLTRSPHRSLLLQHLIIHSPKRPRLLEQLVRPRAHAKIAGEVAPAHDAGVVEEEFGRPGDVASVYARSLVEEVIPANGLEIWIRKQREGVPGFPAEIARLFGSVDADRHRLDARVAELCEMLFDTP
jgi:hypothetical protein